MLADAPTWTEIVGAVVVVLALIGGLVKYLRSLRGIATHAYADGTGYVKMVATLRGEHPVTIGQARLVVTRNWWFRVRHKGSKLRESKTYEVEASTDFPGSVKLTEGDEKTWSFTISSHPQTKLPPMKASEAGMVTRVPRAEEVRIWLGHGSKHRLIRPKVVKGAIK